MPVFSETNLSRAVTHALRHAPGEYGLAVDNDGWVEMRSLVNALSAAGFDGLTEDAVLRMIANSSKVRHEVVGDRIRATYGHSIRIADDLVNQEPPAELFHGTVAEAVSSILEAGILPMKRQHVHLSPDSATAYEVARRHGTDTVLLTVRSREAFEAGVRFQRRGELIWIADAIPPAFVSRTTSGLREGKPGG